jgi:AraC-like DNA-binding protein
MDQQSGQAVLTASDGDFADLARLLFGSVMLDFVGEAARCVTSVSAGEARFSRLQAGAHIVRGDRVVARSDDPDSIKVLLQASGRSRIEQGGQRIDIGPGTAVVYDPTRPYTLVHPEPVRLHIVQISRAHLSRQCRDGLNRPLRAGFRNAAGRTLLNQARLALSGGLSNDTGIDAMEGVLALFGDWSARSRWSLATLRQRALEAMERHLADPELKVGPLASSLGCSSRYLHLAFAEVGETPADCLWGRRLDVAHRHLADASDTRTISDIAYALGFSSSAHFSRLFRQRFDCSPREHRLSASLRRPGTYP